MMSAWAVLASVALQAPMILVWIGGAGVALVRYRRHPLVSQLAAGSCAFLAVTQIAFTSVRTAIPIVFYEQLGVENIGWVFGILGLAESVAFAAGMAALIGAVFVRRPELPAEVA
jgi:hypothetical protein